MRLPNHKLITWSFGVLIAIAAFVNPVFAQKPVPKAFEPGEQLTYKAEISQFPSKKTGCCHF